MGYAQTSNYSFAEEVWNAVTHGFGVVFSVAALSVLVTLAAVYGNAWTVVSCSIFGASMLLLYTASSLYHSIPSAHAKKILKKFDHIAIYYGSSSSYREGYFRLCPRPASCFSF